MKHWIVIRYVKDSSEPFADYFCDMQKLLDLIVLYTKQNIKFSVFEVGPCIGDYS